MGKPIGYFEINTKNGPASQKFYTDLFDWNMQLDEEYGYGMVDTGAGEGINGGIRVLDAQAPRPSTLLYATVEDIAATMQKVKSLGGAVEVEPYEIPGVGTMAVFADLDGNRIGLVTWAQHS